MPQQMAQLPSQNMFNSNNFLGQNISQQYAWYKHGKIVIFSDAFAVGTKTYDINGIGFPFLDRDLPVKVHVIFLFSKKSAGTVETAPTRIIHTKSH